jgi:cell division septation protein DedD
MSPKHLVAAVLLAFVAVPGSAQTVKAGIDAWQRADYAGAVAIWRPLAQQGDPEAAFNLGQAYRLGRGVPLDLGAAQMWYQRAADKGSVDAQTNLGLLLFQNGDHATGLKWLRRAAEQGDARALLVYGTALYNGDGVPQDRLLGYAFIHHAAEQGLAPAKDTLDQLNQLMSEADRQKALALAKSIPNGSPVAASKSARSAKRASSPKAEKPKPEKPARVAEVKPPAAKPRPPAAPPASGGWRIQLGAFSQRGSAEALFQRLSGKSALAGRQPYYVAAGPVTRLQVGPYASRGAAEAACRATGVPCFPVAAK